jgi:hypothetical protein
MISHIKIFFMFLLATQFEAQFSLPAFRKVQGLAVLQGLPVLHENE